MKYHFRKLHGLGNDFVILDHRDSPFPFNADQIKIICDRRFGVGCDQLIVLEEPKTNPADVFMRIYNAEDGLEVGACGSATRCLGALLAEEFQRNVCYVETVSGILETNKVATNYIQVDMGEPIFDWEQIPLAENVDVLNLPIKQGVLSNPVAVSMGNPHMVFFVSDVMGLDIASLGKQLTTHPLFPEQTNVQFVEVLNRKTIRLRIYERGAGVTMSSGTGASASVVAGVKRDVIDNRVRVICDGGNLDITYEKTVKMTGPVGFAFDGVFDENLFESASCHNENEHQSQHQAPLPRSITF